MCFGVVCLGVTATELIAEQVTRNLRLAVQQTSGARDAAFAKEQQRAHEAHRVETRRVEEAQRALEAHRVENQRVEEAQRALCSSG